MAQGEISKTRLLESLYGEVFIGAHQMLAGASAPKAQTLTGAVRLRTLNPTTEDSLDFDLVVPRGVELDVATVTLTPTVRWTTIDTPTADATVIWKLDYCWATPVLAPNVASGTPSKFIDVNTATTAVNTMTGKEYRQHLVTPFPAISFPARNAAPSMIVMGNIRISSVSTAANSLVGILGIGYSYLSGASGTSSITP